MQVLVGFKQYPVFDFSQVVLVPLQYPVVLEGVVEQGGEVVTFNITDRDMLNRWALMNLSTFKVTELPLQGVPHHG